MELNISSPKIEGLSPSDRVSDPEETEISDEDDDDRNHKHRRKETLSESLERDALEQIPIKSYTKRNKPPENGHPYRESNSQSNETWKRCPGFATLPRTSVRPNQSLSPDPGPGKGWGRESGFWSQRTSIDIASQKIQQGSVPPNHFAGRGLASVSSFQNPSWNAYGLLPRIPNGSLDALHPLGMQGARLPSINPSLNIGMPRQRCRDFEERGFCLRGDVCPMEHGINRIVVEDVQSLSQFNLPISLPSAHLRGTPAGSSSIIAPSSSMANSKSLHNKTNISGMVSDGLGLNGASTSSVGGGGADFYDPDQPLWTSGCPEPSTVLIGLEPSRIDETEYVVDADTSGRQHVRLFDGSKKEHPMNSKETAFGSQSTSSSVWGRIGTRSRMEMRVKTDSTTCSSNYNDKETKDDQEPVTHFQVGACQGKQTLAEEIGSRAIDSSLKTQSDVGRNIQKPSQKALRTLFVNGIPQKDNKREALLSHFRKFGEVIDIHIPLNSERAFIQFSTREEAEAALKAPDAVMGNRFIKLWWANRDSISDDGRNNGNNLSVPPCGATGVSVLSVTNRGMDNVQSPVPKINTSDAAFAPFPQSDHPKPVITNGPKAPPPVQKKLENLELLKEELRKKQELLDQKRNEFRRQLDKLEKQSTGLKVESTSEQASKKQKVASVTDVEKTAVPNSTDPGNVAPSARVEMEVQKINSMENIVNQSPKTDTTVMLPESLSSKHSVRPLAPLEAPFVMNRFKLDNRPTAFKIVPPLPIGLVNVDILKEHFSPYGELSVELEGVDSGDLVASNNCSACISFTTRRSAERAFANGKCWQGNNLQFVWVASINPSDGNCTRENPPAGKELLESEPRPTVGTATLDCQNVASHGDGEPAALLKRENGEHTEPDKAQKSSPSEISSVKQLPKRDV